MPLARRPRHRLPRARLGSRPPRAARDLFAIFIGVALSISALPVIAKTLLDLGLFKTDIGLLVMTAAMIDDLVGWVAFSILLGADARRRASIFRIWR